MCIVLAGKQRLLQDNNGEDKTIVMRKFCVGKVNKVIMWRWTREEEVRKRKSVVKIENNTRAELGEWKTRKLKGRHDAQLGKRKTETSVD